MEMREKIHVHAGRRRQMADRGTAQQTSDLIVHVLVVALQPCCCYQEWKDDVPSVDSVMVKTAGDRYFLCFDTDTNRHTASLLHTLPSSPG